MPQPNAQYNFAKPDSLAVRVAAYARRRMYERFLSDAAVQPSETLLDVGVTSDQTYEASNYVEAWYPHKDKITAVGLDDATFLEIRFPGLTYRKADGRNLPFLPNSFDVVHSSAVLEHVGSFDEQRRFLEELVRVARRVVFLTTPNRWYPVEFHSLLPLVHWLPKPWFRRLLRGTKYHFFSLEENLNLLDRAEIGRLCRGLDAERVNISSQRLLGWPSNLLITIEKQKRTSAAT
jgi:ubiquinone/menaquinone biosynthesis C-methylase UbiE